MPIQARIIKKESHVLSFEDFLRKHSITLTIEIWEDALKDQRYQVDTKPYLCVGDSERGGHTGASGYGPFADIALRAFIECIQGKHLTLDMGKTYFTCEEFEWDGILREKVRVKK